MTPQPAQVDAARSFLVGGCDRRCDCRAFAGKGIVGDELETQVRAAVERVFVAAFVDPCPVFTAGARRQPELIRAGSGEAIAPDGGCSVEIEFEDDPTMDGWMAVIFLELDGNVDALPTESFGPERTIQGKVEDTEGNPIPNINVAFIDTSISSVI